MSTSQLSMLRGVMSDNEQDDMNEDEELEDIMQFVAQGSLARDGPLSDPEFHGSVSSVAQGSLARDVPLSDTESHGSVSSVA